jgi:hypothetical protein
MAVAVRPGAWLGRIVAWDADCIRGGRTDYASFADLLPHHRIAHLSAGWLPKRRVRRPELGLVEIVRQWSSRDPGRRPHRDTTAPLSQCDTA